MIRDQTDETVNIVFVNGYAVFHVLLMQYALSFYLVVAIPLSQIGKFYHVKRNDITIS